MAHLSGPMAYPQQTSEVVGSSAPKISLGCRARDVSGNEYVYVDFQSAFTVGEAVAITTTFTGVQVTTATVGPIGLACGTATSDSCGWIQVYGSGSALGSSLLVIGAVGLGDTTGGYSYLLPYTTTLVHVEGIYVTLGTTGGTASSGFTLGSSVGTANTSVLGGLVTVQLNYPFISGGPHVTEAS